MTQTEEIKHPEWLSPSAALSRFKPVKGMLTSAQAVLRKQLRYGFRVADIGLLISAGTASELVDSMRVYPLPQAPSWLIGLINLRGNLAPICDLKQLLGLTEESSEKQRILVLDKDDKAVGILIDGFPQAVDTSHPLLRLPPLPNELRPYTHKAYSKGKTVWLEFDHQGFFQSLNIS